MTWFRVSKGEFERLAAKGQTGGPPKPPRPSSPRELFKERMDSVWSFIVRRRHVKLFGPNCRICQKRPIEVGYHIVPWQMGDSVRWLIEDGCGACVPCNFGEHKNRAAYRKKHVKIFGREFMDAMEAKAGPIKLKDAQLKEVMAWLTGIAEGPPDGKIPEAPACLTAPTA